jgi:hypothetical protein
MCIVVVSCFILEMNCHMHLCKVVLHFMCYYNVWQCHLPTTNTYARPSWTQRCIKKQIWKKSLLSPKFKTHLNIRQSPWAMSIEGGGSLQSCSSKEWHIWWQSLDNCNYLVATMVFQYMWNLTIRLLDGYTLFTRHCLQNLNMFE